MEEKFLLRKKKNPKHKFPFQLLDVFINFYFSKILLKFEKSIGTTCLVKDNLITFSHKNKHTQYFS